MRLALFDPQHGYYSCNVRTVGRGGDFSTTATLHGALGEAIASWIGTRDVIEVGGGDGSLADGVLKSLGWWRRRRTRYHMVEKSGPLAAQQRERLQKYGARVRWHEEMESALAACGGIADVFSNELVDAFPAQVLRWDSARGRWDELAVTGGGEIVAAGASDYVCDWQPTDGQRIERHRSYREWLRGWVPAWSRGRMLTIDYGGEFPDLYRRRPMGSLRAYFAQMRLDEPGEFFQRAGKQDLTADVNFTDLLAWGEEAGLVGGTLMDQRAFLLACVPGLEQRAQREPELAFLIAAAGAGGACRVLEQRKSQGAK